MSDERPFVKFMSAVHEFWYRLTGGLIGGRVMGAPVLLLTTTGRKTGKLRTRPLLYLADGDSVVVVASNGGDDHDPAWWVNLKENPQAEVQVGSINKRVSAHRASAKEKRRLWPLLNKMYPGYDGYQKRTKRDIPVVILRPAETAEARS